MRPNSSQVTLVFIVGVLLYLSSMTLGAKAESREARGQFYSKAKAEQRTSLMDTFSLSFAGNFDFAQIMDGLRKIFEGIATFIDLKVIKSGVDFFFDRFMSTSPSNDITSNKVGPLPRRDDFVGEDVDKVEMEMILKKRSKERHLRNGVTALIGALLQKQKCWENTACRVGFHLLEPVAAKDVLFIMADKVITPGKWRSTFDIVKQSATKNAQCQQFQCDPNIDGRDL